MQTKEQIITAGVATPLTVNGRFFMLLEAGAPLDVEFRSTAASGDACEGIEAGFNLELDHGQQLLSIVVTSAVTQTIKWIYGNGRIGYDRATLVGQSASSLVDAAPITVGLAPTLLTAAGFRKALAVRNTHAEPLYVCGPAGTDATAGYEIQPGDTWEVPSNLVCAELYGLFVTVAGPVAVMPGV